MPTAYAPPNKVRIFGLEIDVALTAQYNPKEIQIEKSVTWTPSASSKNDRPDLEFASVGARTLSMELLFDTYEDQSASGAVDVAAKYVSKLMQLISVIDHDGVEAHRRPSVVQVRWDGGEHPIFEGVLQSVSTKYTMFAPCGRPVRATCTVKLMEATRSFKNDPDRKVPLSGQSQW